MGRVAVVAVALATALTAGLLPGVPAGAADAAAAASSAAPPKPVVTVSPTTVVQQDPVTLRGSTSQQRVTVYRRLYGGPWTRIGSVRARHGHFSYRTRPVPGRTNLYRTSAAGKPSKSGQPATSRVVQARSIGCTPLPGPGSVATWTQDTTVVTTLTTNWTQLICSAAPNSTITMAEMYVYENSATVSRLMSALAAVHYYRGVDVQVLVQRNGYYPGGQWASLKRHFAFAEVHYCSYGCRSTNPSGHAHTKFMVLSKTIFGRSALLESSANWSHEQFDQQRQSGIYVYGNAPLTDAFLEQWYGQTTHADLVTTGWQYAAGGIWYAFDPRPATSDPIATELSTLSCEPGDSIGVADTGLTRPTLVAQLTRLQQAGCTVQALIDPSGDVSTEMVPASRSVVVHDKFLVITAHDAVTGAVRQDVVHGSENFSTGSMTLSDQQLLMVRRPDVWAAYHWWFGYLYQRSVPLVPTPTPPPPDPDRVPTRVGGVVGASSCARPVQTIDDDDVVPAACAGR